MNAANELFFGKIPAGTAIGSDAIMPDRGRKISPASMAPRQSTAEAGANAVP